MATPTRERIAARAAKDPKFKARALKNAGLRSALPESMLTAKDRAKRQLNTRLNSPVAAGSTMTGRDLAHQAAAATSVEYGPVEADLKRQYGEAQQRQRDVGGWYDQYLAQLAEGSKNVANIQAGVAGQLGQLSQGATGIATDSLNQLQGQANAAAAQQGIAPAGNLAPTADAAAKVRQNLVGSFQAQQALTGGAQQGYMEQLAHLVGPTQKLGALAQEQGKIGAVRTKQSDLAREKAAFNQKTRTDLVKREQQYGVTVAGLDLKDKLAQADAANKAAANSPQTKYQNALITQAAKYGYNPHQWALLGPTGRRNVMDADKAKPDDSIYSSGAFAGKSKSQIAGMTDTQRQGLIDAYDKKHGGKSKSTGKGPNWATSEQSGAALTQATMLKTLAQKAKTGEYFGKKKKTDPLDRRGAGVKMLGYAGSKLKNPILVTAALDAVYDGHLSAPTVKALIAARYKPSDVARALGVPTAGQRTPGDLLRDAATKIGKQLPGGGG